MTNANGENEFGVTFGRIMFLQKILESHKNIEGLTRHDDLVFEVERLDQGDTLSIVCVDEYVVSLELVMRVLHKFPETNIIFVGGKWNGYTMEAYEFCQDRMVGIYNATELAGGLYKKTYWTYEKVDDEGNSTKSIKG